MKDNKNVTIAILSVSAAILLTILVTMHLTTPAYASTSIRGGDYIMCTGAYSSGTDILYVVNTAQQKVNAYVVDITHPDKPELILRDTVNLKLAFKGK